MPDVSVIIPTFNCAHFLPQTIDSVMSQTFHDLEILVVDDGSTDDTRAVVEACNTSIRYIYQKNQGPSAARNTGIRESRGKYLAFLDSDDLWLPGKLEKQTRVMENLPSTGLVYSDLYYFDSETGSSLGTYPNHHLFASGKILARLFLDNFIQMSTQLVRREVFREVGLFDESLWSCEDWDMWLRVSGRFDVGFVDEPLSMHRLHLGNRSKQVRDRDTLVVLQKTLDRNPGLSEQLGILKNRKLAATHARFAIALMETGGSLQEARHHLRESIALNREHFPYYFYLILSFLGSRSSTLFLKWEKELLQKREYS